MNKKYLLYLQCEYSNEETTFHHELYTSLQACINRVEELKRTLPKLLEDFVIKEFCHLGVDIEVIDNSVIASLLLLDSGHRFEGIKLKINYIEILEDMPYDVDLYNLL